MVALSSKLNKHTNALKQWSAKHKTKIYVVLITTVVAFIYFKPQQFIDVWLTRDQQGQLLFNLGKYDQSATRFTNTRWQAYSLYGAEKFDQSATMYSQFKSADDRLARANALAHNRRYVKARDMYKDILLNFPEDQSALHNQQLVQKIIDDNNRLSESQKAEEGDSSDELGDEPQTSDGAEKKQARKQVIEQMSAEQLLLDPALNDMWLRQVQKDPAQFLSRKFLLQTQLQNEASKTLPTTKETVPGGGNDNE
ncbi:tol-pal system YbgF family protein [Colwelliaceae bacterium BS250]